MRFYQQQHEFYCGVDLHARSMHVCIVDGDGQTKVHKNIEATPDRFLPLIRPYRKGLVVCVLAGQRFGVREKIFDAVVDKVEVKPLREVSPREIQHDNPEMRHIDEFVHFLGQIYNREVTEDDTVTVIHFSEIRAGA